MRDINADITQWNKRFNIEIEMHKVFEALYRGIWQVFTCRVLLGVSA